MKFQNRQEAGQQLGAALKSHAGRSDLIVFGLPRGGVLVAYEVAKALHAPLDVFLVRKLGTPWQEELAMGAIALGDVTVFNQELVRGLNISEEAIQAVITREKKVLAERNRLYRHNQPLPSLVDKTVILIDDGIATGATVRAAIYALKKLGCAHIVIAVPVAPTDTLETLRQEVDEVICLYSPQEFYAIGRWYEEFPQITDTEVQTLLAKR